MAPNNDDSRRDRDRPEDNPFIAFRRFADSQVSSLLNTVFTLPATIANFNNVHHAREQCLFGRADSIKCHQLHELEDQIAQLRSEGRELYRIGDLQAVLKKGEELIQLDRQADELRKDIVEDARKREGKESDARKQTELVEKVGNEKGQQWGWSWSWGFPRPFDEEDNLSEERGHNRRMCRRWHRRKEEDIMKQAEEEWEQFNAKWEDIKKRINEEWPRAEEGQPKVWRWSFTWPPPADAPNPNAPSNERSQTLFDGLGDMIVDEVNRMMFPSSFTFRNGSYSPGALEDNEELNRAGVHWRDAYEDLVRAERGAPLMPPEKLGESSNMTYSQWARRFWDPDFARPTPSRQARANYPKRVPWEGEETNEEPSYEYGHDHEDQHDDPPTPKVSQGRWPESMPETELDAYERMLGPASAPAVPAREDGRPPVLSTLTTTERTVAPDGTVTTKVVLKKRFADGREESSETVHAQRGQDGDVRKQDPWKAMQEAQFPSGGKQSPSQNTPGKKDNEKKNGWFWSG